MRAALRQEEIRRLSKTESSSKGIRVKQKEDVALASEGKEEKQKKKDVSKVKCFNCGALGHHVTQCPWRKGKGEASTQRLLQQKLTRKARMKILP